MSNQISRKCRTSTPIPGTTYFDPQLSSPIYDDWKFRLHCSSGKHLKVRGLKNPPKDLISGHILLNSTSNPSKIVRFTRRIDFIDAENQHLDEIYGDKQKIIDVVKPVGEDKRDVPEDVQDVLNEAITCSAYAKQIEERNCKIKEKFLPMLQRGLKRLCFPKKFQADKEKEQVEQILVKDETTCKDTYLLVLH